MWKNLNKNLFSLCEMQLNDLGALRVREARYECTALLLLWGWHWTQTYGVYASPNYILTFYIVSVYSLFVSILVFFSTTKLSHVPVVVVTDYVVELAVVFNGIAASPNDLMYTNIVSHRWVPTDVSPTSFNQELARAADRQSLPRPVKKLGRFCENIVVFIKN